MNDRYAAVRKQRLCYGCLGKGHAIKNCKVNACGINGFTKKHNRLLHSENQMDEGNHAVNMSAATISQSSEVMSFLQIVPVSIQSGSNKLNAYAFLDSGSTVSFNDQSVNERLRAEGTDVTLKIASIHGTKDLKTEMVSIKIKGPHSIVQPINAFVHPSMSLGTANYDYNNLKQSFNHFNLLPNKTFNLMDVGIILGQDPYELQNKNTKWTNRCSNRIGMGSQWTHDRQEKTKHLSFRLHRRCEIGWEYPKMVGHRSLCFQS